MALTVEQGARIQVEITLDATWEGRTAAVPSTEEAREMWDALTVQIAEIERKGGMPESLHD